MTIVAPRGWTHPRPHFVRFFARVPTVHQVDRALQSDFAALVCQGIAVLQHPFPWTPPIVGEFQPRVVRVRWILYRPPVIVLVIDDNVTAALGEGRESRSEPRPLGGVVIEVPRVWLRGRIVGWVRVDGHRGSVGRCHRRCQRRNLRRRSTGRGGRRRYRRYRRCRRGFQSVGVPSVFAYEVRVLVWIDRDPAVVQRDVPPGATRNACNAVHQDDAEQW